MRDPNEPTSPTAASLDLPDVEADFPSACDLLTASELTGIVNNEPCEGSGLGFVCDWHSSASDEARYTDLAVKVMGGRPRAALARSGGRAPILGP